MLQPAGLPSWNFNLDSTESSGAILAQKLMEEVAIEVSHVILGPPSETPCDDVNDAILRGSQPRKAGRMTSQQSFDYPNLFVFINHRQGRTYLFM